jgi:chromosomal replication initiation ATPase DnaA
MQLNHIRQRLRALILGWIRRLIEAALLEDDSNEIVFEPPRSGIDALVERVATAFGVEIAELLGHRRTYLEVEARHVAMALCRAELGLSYPAIARAFGGRDHTTVMHAVNRVANSPTLSARMQQLRSPSSTGDVSAISQA